MQLYKQPVSKPDTSPPERNVARPEPTIRRRLEIKAKPTFKIEGGTPSRLSVPFPLELRIHAGEEPAHVAYVLLWNEFNAVSISEYLQMLAGTDSKGVTHRFGDDHLECGGHLDLVHAFHRINVHCTAPAWLNRDSAYLWNRPSSAGIVLRPRPIQMLAHQVDQ